MDDPTPGHSPMMGGEIKGEEEVLVVERKAPPLAPPLDGRGRWKRENGGRRGFFVVFFVYSEYSFILKEVSCWPNIPISNGFRQGL